LIGGWVLVAIAAMLLVAVLVMVARGRRPVSAETSPRAGYPPAGCRGTHNTP
jgi:hypothetical protein